MTLQTQTQTHLLKHFKISKMSSGPYISKNTFRAKVQVKNKSIEKEVENKRTIILILISR